MQCLACRRDRETGAEFTFYYGTQSRQRLPGVDFGPGRPVYRITGRGSGWVCDACLRSRSRWSLALLVACGVIFLACLLLPGLGLPVGSASWLVLLAYAILVQFLPPGSRRAWGELLVLKANKPALLKQGFNAFLPASRYERLKKRRDPLGE